MNNLKELILKRDQLTKDLQEVKTNISAFITKNHKVLEQIPPIIQEKKGRLHLLDAMEQQVSGGKWDFVDIEHFFDLDLEYIQVLEDIQVIDNRTIIMGFKDLNRHRDTIVRFKLPMELLETDMTIKNISTIIDHYIARIVNQNILEKEKELLKITNEIKDMEDVL